MSIMCMLPMSMFIIIPPMPPMAPVTDLRLGSSALTSAQAAVKVAG